MWIGREEEGGDKRSSASANFHTGGKLQLHRWRDARSAIALSSESWFVVYDWLGGRRPEVPDWSAGVWGYVPDMLFKLLNE